MTGNQRHRTRLVGLLLLLLALLSAGHPCRFERACSCWYGIPCPERTACCGCDLA